MATPVYTKALMRIAGPAAGTLNVTVPAGKVWVFRCIDVCFLVAGTGSLLVGVTGLGPFIQFQWNNSPFLEGHWEGRQAFAAGETITFQWTLAMNAGVTGYELSVP